jgi:hypothetical protein
MLSNKQLPHLVSDKTNLDKLSFDLIDIELGLAEAHKILNNKIEFYKEDIILRNESLKDTLDLIEDELINDLEKIKFKLNETRKRAILQRQLSFEEIHEIQNTLKRTKVSLNSRKIDKNILGKVSRSNSFEYLKSIECEFECEIDAKWLARMIYIEKTKSLLIVDELENSLKIIRINSTNELIQEEHFLNKWIKSPTAIAFNNSNNLFISSYQTGLIIVLNENYEFRHKFGHLNESFKIEHMKIDEFDDSLLYCTDWSNDFLLKYDCSKGILVNKIKLNKPFYVYINQEKLYITSGTLFDKDCDTLKLKGILKGSNCIYVLNKQTLEYLNRIEMCDWLTPNGIYFDNHLNLITIAYKLNNETKEISREKTLFVFNSKNNKCLNEIQIEDLREFCDMIIKHDKLYVIYETKKIINDISIPKHFIKIFKLKF